MNSPLPALSKYGFLPAGTYTVSLKEVGDRFGTGSTKREELWKNFLRFIDWISEMKAFQAIELGGSFLTDVKEPSDIDVALEFRHLELPIDSAFALLNKENTAQIKDEFKVQVVVKQLNAEPYIMVVRGFVLATNRIPLFRVLKEPDRLRVSKNERRYVPYNEEYRGVIRVLL